MTERPNIWFSTTLHQGLDAQAEASGWASMCYSG